MANKLSKAQKNALEYLQQHGSKEFKRGYDGSDVLPYRKLVQLGYAKLSPLMKSVNRHYVVYTLTTDGSHESSTPAAVESVETKTTLTWELARDLLAEDPNRIDIFLLYANSIQVATSIKWSVDGFWDVTAGGWRMSFDGNNIAYTHTSAAQPETSQPEAATATPDGNDSPVFIETEHGGGVTLDAPFAAQAEPVADDAIPFASFDSAPVTLLTDDLLAASRAGWGQRYETLIADSKVTGHGRTSRNRSQNTRKSAYKAHSGDYSNKRGQRPANMQKRYIKPLERKQRPVANVIQIEEILRSMGIVGRAA